MPLFQTDIAKGAEAAQIEKYAPQEAYQHAEQGRQLVQENALKLQQSMQEAQDNTAMRELTKQYASDPSNAKKSTYEKQKDLADIAMKSGRIKEAEKFSDMAEKTQDRTFKAQELQLKQFDHNMDRVKTYIDSMSSPEDWPLTRMRMLQDGILKPQDLQQVEKDIATMGFEKAQEKYHNIYTSSKEKIDMAKQKVLEAKAKADEARQERIANAQIRAAERISARQAAGESSAASKQAYQEFGKVTSALDEIRKEKTEFIKEKKPKEGMFYTTDSEKEAIQSYKERKDILDQREKDLAEAQKRLLSQMSPEDKKTLPKESPKGKLSSEQEDWISRAMKANPGMSKEDIIAEGKKIGKL